MEIKELLVKRRTLERDLHEVISPLLEKFYEETGISVWSVYVNFLTVTEIGASFSEHVLDKVTVKLDIEEGGKGS